MRNTIKILPPIINGNRIEYNYKIAGEWIEAFNLDEKFYIEYSCDISNVPSSTAIIPLLCNIFPIAWIYDAEIYAESCDKAFFDSIPEFKKGYIDMYPKVNFGGNIFVERLEQNQNLHDNGSAAFFSGGVDAFNTLVNHAEEKPLLLTVWGADVKFEDKNGWKNVTDHLKTTASEFQVDYVTIKSSFRRFISEACLYRKVINISGDNWWHGFQHGIGIIGHAAPVCYVYNKSTVYFASSFTIAEKGKVTCASDPTIDNYVKFGSTCVIHDGYEFNRQAKVHNITQFVKKTGIKISLRVCWKSTGGKNCCQCEKCWRTILALYAESSVPSEYGFNFSDYDLKKMSKDMKKCYNPMFSELRYKPIQDAMRKNLEINQVPEELKWFYKIDIKKLGYHPYRKFLGKCFQKGKRVISRIVK